MRRSLLARLYHWLTTDHAHAVSAAWLADHTRTSGQRGVDLPYWRLPKDRGVQS